VTKGGRGLYGVWDGKSGTPATNTTLGAGCGGLAVAASTRPILGTSWDLAITGIPAAGAIGLEIFGLSDPGFDDLDFLGMPGCGLRSSLDVVNTFPVAGSSHAYSLLIPSTPSLVGMSVFTTGAVFLDPPTNPFGAITANGLRGSLGDI
jgi:hypothetical protein